MQYLWNQLKSTNHSLDFKIQNLLLTKCYNLIYQQGPFPTFSYSHNDGGIIFCSHWECIICEIFMKLFKCSNDLLTYQENAVLLERLETLKRELDEERLRCRSRYMK